MAGAEMAGETLFQNTLSVVAASALGKDSGVAGGARRHEIAASVSETRL